MKVFAGIVLYKPNKERLHDCLLNILDQFEEIILFDNVGDQNSLQDANAKISYYTENKNQGVAYALNVIFKVAKEKGADWVVTLDQDTIIPVDYRRKCEKLFGIPNVAIIAPQVIDKRRPYFKAIVRNEFFIDIDYCITSASCTNINIWEKLGGFDEWLFIDFVDGDYCKRIKIEGYRILQLSDVIIDQEFGDISLKSPWKVKFFLWLSKVMKNINVAKLSYNKKVKPLRVYYVHRNLLYLNKKYQKHGGIGYRNFNCNSFGGFLLYFTLPSIVRGGEKIKIVKAVIDGLYDGYNSRPVKY